MYACAVYLKSFWNRINQQIVTEHGFRSHVDQEVASFEARREAPRRRAWRSPTLLV